MLGYLCILAQIDGQIDRQTSGMKLNKATALLSGEIGDTFVCGTFDELSNFQSSMGSHRDTLTF